MKHNVEIPLSHYDDNTVDEMRILHTHTIVRASRKIACPLSDGRDATQHARVWYPRVTGSVTSLLTPALSGHAGHSAPF